MKVFGRNLKVTFEKIEKPAQTEDGNTNENVQEKAETTKKTKKGLCKKILLGIGVGIAGALAAGVVMATKVSDGDGSTDDNETYDDVFGEVEETEENEDETETTEN